MKENGLKTCNMVLEQKPGTMEVPDIQANFSRGKSMARADSNGKMEAIMMETSLMVSSKALESITLLI